MTRWKPTATSNGHTPLMRDELRELKKHSERFVGDYGWTDHPTRGLTRYPVFPTSPGSLLRSTQSRGFSF